MDRVCSWARYPNYPQTAHPITWRDQLPLEWRQVVASTGTTLAYGNGRSYGDSCLASSDHVLHMRHLDRFIAADWQAGTVRAEAGVTLQELLAAAVPRGWMLAVTPGTQYVTLGGAVANDVHGKNHHVRGTFGRHVRRFALLRSDGKVLECSADNSPELYSATIGGLGLTGVIVWVELQLMPIRSSDMNVTSLRFGNLDEFFALSEELDPLHEYTVAWVDCLQRGAHLGRGVFMVADHAETGRLSVPRKRKRTVPFAPPVSLVNPLTLRAFNAFYYHRHPARTVRMTVDYDSYFYPLDGVLEWHRIYGRRGFQQYQCVLPPGESRTGMKAILDAIGKSGTGSFLAVLKRCGDMVSPGLLSFPMAGTSLALDFPQHDAKNRRLFDILDAIVREAGGRIYPAKDAHISGEDFRAAYPAWQRLEALRDPALMSRFWQRTTQL
ncbi:FAD-binding oxidoreductase [Burkholderia multivorans]|uniref:FAD-binding oxidoreductase n=1 Tax=Burkholderia multivorans TaxID=87883 RepID=UPI0012DE74EF|nr:FAD-binding oxidoreductase [Burkholderia multivorans]MBU9340287.1 FAD-binding oxidoreductase [Burkholderia multivorans]MCA8141197.1 FAD-binding oxidoreductase [Burkholderia multivorans]MCA8374204.1 FAD-binding oxidoreductase [Burkholderia multivorans]QGR61730.1 FAD-binding protein [Burkholderia multivorans]WVN04232.1 FAD-binding oxidoreductase [Burkholderia multivorans]